MYKVPEEWKLSDFLELSNDEKLKWLYNGVKNAGGGSDLPEVTSADNGDVLTVVNGEWDKATPSGSSDAFEVKFTAEWSVQAQAFIVTSDKTYSEINTAYTTNKKIYAWLSLPDTELLTVGYLIIDSSFVFTFANETDALTFIGFNVNVNSESISAVSFVGGTPVYAGITLQSGDHLDATTLNLYFAAINSDSYFYIDITDEDIGGAASFIFSNNYGGYCFAGPPEAIGATATIDDETGLVTVTAPNS